MNIAGFVLLPVLAILGAALAALVMVSGWNALREELVPGFRIEPPRWRTVALVLLSVVAPIALIAVFLGYFAVIVLGSL